MESSARSGEYDAITDPYCYPASPVLKNIHDLTDAAALAEFETISTTQRADEPLPHGNFDVDHYKAIHHHLFQDVYEWAGTFRTVRISKDGSAFCYPEHIEGEIRALFEGLKNHGYLQGLSSDAFAEAVAHFVAELNAIHPFREGNGRTQTAFLTLLSEQAGHPLVIERLAPERFLTATIASFRGDEVPLRAEIRRLIN